MTSLLNTLTSHEDVKKIWCYPSAVYMAAKHCLTRYRQPRCMVTTVEHTNITRTCKESLVLPKCTVHGCKTLLDSMPATSLHGNNMELCCTLLSTQVHVDNCTQICRPANPLSFKAMAACNCRSCHIHGPDLLFDNSQSQ